MRSLILLAAALLAGAPCARADEAHDLARRVVALSGGVNAVDKVFSMMRGSMIRDIESGSGKAPQVAAGIVDGLIMPSVRGAVPTIQAMVVEIEVHAYSLADLRGLVAFYTSPVGRDLLAKQPEIVAAIIPATMKIVQDRLRQTLIDQSTELKKQGVNL